RGTNHQCFFITHIKYYYAKNLDASAGVGIIQVSCFPNHLYRLAATYRYNPSRMNTGTIIKPYNNFQPPLNCFTTCSAAVDRANALPPCNKTKELRSPGGIVKFWSSFCPVSLCKEANKNWLRASCLITN